jgi:hypothetical protein
LYKAWIRIAADRVEGWIDLVRRKKICHQVAVKTGTARLGFDGKSRQGLRLEKTLTLALSQFGEYTKLGEAFETAIVSSVDKDCGRPRRRVD